MVSTNSTENNAHEGVQDVACYIQHFPDMALHDCDQRCLEPVSYTHLDVYKRQGLDGHQLQPVESYGAGRVSEMGFLG